jgi:hypothetical protein
LARLEETQRPAAANPNIEKIESAVSRTALSEFGDSLRQRWVSRDAQPVAAGLG